MKVRELIAILETLPPNTEIVQAKYWEDAATPITTIDDLGWHFSNYEALSWCPNELLVPRSQFAYYPTFRRALGTKTD